MNKEEGMIKKELKGVQLVIGAFGSEEGCTGIVESIEYSETGGILTKYVGCNYLFKGYPNAGTIDYIYASKRVITGLLLLALNKSFRLLFSITFLFFLILPRRVKRQIIIGLMDCILGITHWIEYKAPFALPVERYCVSVKEIYRVSEVILQDIKDKEIILRIRKFRDIFCMIAEMDYAYRARLQDILPELNKDKLKENPKQELERLFDILIEREAVDGYNAMTDKWKGLKKAVMIMFNLRSLRKMIVKTLLEINLEKIKRDEADWYYVLNRKDYQYGGIPYEERMKISDELDKKMNNNRPQIIFKTKE